MYRIYYTHEGEITTVGASDQPGDYIECDLDTMLAVQKSVHLYEIKNQKLVKKQLEQTKTARQFKIVEQAPGWICAKDNLFEVIEYATIQPKWFDDDKHSWIQYD